MLLEDENKVLRLSPRLGGGVVSFRWHGREIFHVRPEAPGPLALGCFPLSPFSGRIADGRFSTQDYNVLLRPNHPSDPTHEHALHGFDWLSSFQIVEAAATRALLRREHEEEEWPWTYSADQEFTLTKAGYRHALSVENRGRSPMPVGLGLHPFLPRQGAAMTLDVKGFWQTTSDQIPTFWRKIPSAPDWLNGEVFDHCFTDLRGKIIVDWPTHRLTIEPDPAFTFAVVFTPLGADYFCVEPVSHMPDAVNRKENATITGLRWLAPGERWATETIFSVSETGRRQ